MINGNLKYSKDEIKEIKDSMNFSKVTMEGFHDDLEKLKDSIEIFYDKKIFPLEWCLADAPFYGWEGETLRNMKNINHEICKRIEEIYAIVLCGLDEDIK